MYDVYARVGSRPEAPNLRLFQRYPAVFLIVKGCSYAEVGTIIPRSISFLQTVQEHYNGDRIVRILDNARIHHAKLIHPFLDEHQDTLTLMFLPPSSPQLNGI